MLSLLLVLGLNLPSFKIDMKLDQTSLTNLFSMLTLYQFTKDSYVIAWLKIVLVMGCLHLVLENGMGVRWVCMVSSAFQMNGLVSRSLHMFMAQHISTWK